MYHDSLTGHSPRRSALAGFAHRLFKEMITVARYPDHGRSRTSRSITPASQRFCAQSPSKSTSDCRAFAAQPASLPKRAADRNPRLLRVCQILAQSRSVPLARGALPSREWSDHISTIRKVMAPGKEETDEVVQPKLLPGFSGLMRCLYPRSESRQKARFST